VRGYLTESQQQAIRPGRVAAVEIAACAKQIQTHSDAIQNWLADCHGHGCVRHLFSAEANGSSADMQRLSLSSTSPLPPHPLYHAHKREEIFAAKDLRTSELTEELHFQPEDDYDDRSEASREAFYDMQYEESRRRKIAELVVTYKKIGKARNRVKVCMEGEQPANEIVMLLQRYSRRLEQGMIKLKELAFDIGEDDEVVNQALEKAMGYC